MNIVTCGISGRNLEPMFLLKPSESHVLSSDIFPKSAYSMNMATAIFATDALQESSQLLNE